jgi:hypothetical protein
VTDEQKRWIEIARESLRAAEVLEQKRLNSSATSDVDTVEYARLFLEKVESLLNT